MGELPLGYQAIPPPPILSRLPQSQDRTLGRGTGGAAQRTSNTTKEGIITNSGFIFIQITAPSLFIHPKETGEPILTQFFCCCCFVWFGDFRDTEFHEAKAGLKLTMQLKLALIL